MKRMLAALVAAIVVPLSAHAVPIPYEFSATLDSIGYNSFEPIPADIQAAFNALRGQAIVGTFRYESDVGPPVISIPTFSIYNGLMTDLAASVAGFDVTSAFGSGMVRSSGQDRLALSAASIPPPASPLPPPPTFGQILGYEVRGFNLAWVEGVPQDDNPVPPFLTDNNPPLTLPSYQAQINVALWVPGITPTNPSLTTNVSLSTLKATVRPVTVPEPSSLALLAFGIAGAVASRRRERSRP